ncbi:MAG: 5-(carboxyamino)imidazole ribonucleotide synthase [Hyphomicrobiales bacterium]
MSDQALPPVAVPPCGIIGILGGGQLGRMLALAAAEMGLNCHIYCPDPKSPAFDVVSRSTCADYDDETALAAFSRDVDAVTFEFENVPPDTVDFLSSQLPVRPGGKALRITQDRLKEKRFIESLGRSCAPFMAVDSLDDLIRGVKRLSYPAILKTRRFGYDGKGQVMLHEGDDPALAFAAIGEAPAIVEGFVPFAKEISALVARGRDGRIALYDIAENHHENHILRVSRVPAAIEPSTREAALEIARHAVERLDYVGVLAIEFFVLEEEAKERLVINEFAPRVHNSGHWTQDGCAVSQFAQHIRAVAGWPLARPVRLADVEMTNLIGDEVNGWRTLALEPAAVVHFYAKAESREGRKMGHINRLTTLSRSRR